jgi:hypothetical protein
MQGALFKFVATSISALGSFALYANCVTILDVADRPSIIDSACSVPFKKVVIESNYINLQAINHAGIQQNYPNTELRIGLPLSNEFIVQFPNYIQQKKAPKSGSTSLFAGMKHSKAYGKQWLFAVEGFANAASGSYYYGSQHWGGVVNAITNYSINSKLNLSAMIGLSRLSVAPAEGGRYYTSVNPDVTLTISLADKLSVYGEIYGQSKTSPYEGAGFNCDAGFILQVASNTLVNFSAGQQLHNYLGGFTHYINAGFSIML